jgi:macrolide transport system ATP-binding/permease protein
VQIALGAQREDILRLILRHAFQLVGTGIALGILSAFFTARLLRSFLYGVDQHDALTIAAVSIPLASVSLLASYLPARRAANIEPMEALRSE